MDPGRFGIIVLHDLYPDLHPGPTDPDQDPDLTFKIFEMFIRFILYGDPVRR